MAAYSLPYLLLISLDSNVADRYLLPVYPLFALLAALAARASFGRLPGRVPALVACIAILLLPTWIALRFAWLGFRPDTFEQLAAWIESQPEATSKKVLLSPAIAPPLLPTVEALESQLATLAGRSQPWFRYLGELDALPSGAPRYRLFSIAPGFFTRAPAPSFDEIASYFDREQPEWIVFEVSKRVFAAAGPHAFYEVLQRRGQLAARFSGEGGRHPGQIPIDYQGVRDLAMRSLSASAFGAQLEVYRWPAR